MNSIVKITEKHIYDTPNPDITYRGIELIITKTFALRLKKL